MCACFSFLFLIDACITYYSTIKFSSHYEYVNLVINTKAYFKKSTENKDFKFNFTIYKLIGVREHMVYGFKNNLKVVFSLVTNCYKK